MGTHQHTHANAILMDLGHELSAHHLAVSFANLCSSEGVKIHLKTGAASCHHLIFKISTVGHLSRTYGCIVVLMDV